MTGAALKIACIRHKADIMLFSIARHLLLTACAVFGASGFFSSHHFSGGFLRSRGLSSGLTGSSTVRRPGVTYSQLSDLKSGKLKFEDVINLVGAAVSS
jgi:hypothetical protein